MVLNSILVLGGIGLIFGLGLAFLGEKLKVRVDPLEEKILQVLPGSNCGACGFAGCAGYASACAKGKVDIGKCSLGGVAVAHKISEILGRELEVKESKLVVVTCQGGKDTCIDKFIYEGVEDCNAANLVSGGHRECDQACLGFGTCMNACLFGAISMEKGLPVINEEKCVGCGNCVIACPKGIIVLIPKRQQVYIACRSEDKRKRVREICKKGCIGCGICVKVCPKEAISIKDNLARIDYDKCNNCGICVEKCPTKSILSKNLPTQMQFLS